jgi:large subunit ribosomal protein L35
MPKIKSNRAARKRFRVTGTGKIMRNQAYKTHILTKMTRKRKRNLAKSIVVNKANLKRVKRMMGM